MLSSTSSDIQERLNSKPAPSQEEEFRQAFAHCIALKNDPSESRSAFIEDCVPLFKKLENAPDMINRFHEETALLIRSYLLTQLTRGHSTQALKTCEHWFALLEGNPNSVGDAIRHLFRGDVYLRLGQLDNALEFSTKAYQAAIDAKLAKNQLPKFLVAVANAYNSLERHEESLQWLTQALALALDDEPGLKSQQAILCNMCYSATELGEFDRAIELGTRCLQLFPPKYSGAFGLTPAYAYIHNNLAAAWIGKKNLDKAKEYYLLGLNLNTQLSSEIGILYSLRGLGKTEQLNGNDDKALQYFEDAAEIARQIQAADQEYDCYRLIAELYRARGEFETAYHYLKRFHETYRSVMEYEQKNSIETLQTQHQTQLAMLEAKELTNANEKLEQQVAARIADLRESLVREEELKLQLQDALQVSKRVSHLRYEMIKTISHELRTPATAINVSAEILQNYYERIQTTKRTVHIQRIETNVQALIAMLNRATEADEIHQQTPFLGLARLSVLTIIDTLSGRVKENDRVTFVANCDSNRTTELDLEQLIKAFDATLDNALTLSNKNVDIHVQCDENISIQLVDQGIGVTKDEMPHIFDLFYRSPRVEFERGLGIGLFIANQSLALMGGTILVESSGKDQGTTVTLTVPLGKK